MYDKYKYELSGITASGIPCYTTTTEKPTNCVRCGAAVMSYQTDCEYCGKTLKEKTVDNRPSTPCSG